MSKPCLEQYEQSCATWVRQHRQIKYTLSHHGISKSFPEGTWCYYLHLLENMFQNADDFALFNKEREIKEGLTPGTVYAAYDYYSTPDLEFHGGPTWYSKEEFLCRNKGEFLTAVKIGCDYNHAWDADEGYWQLLEDVERDAKRSIDVLCNRFPMNKRCGYTGVIALPEDFYESKNGPVHRETPVKHPDLHTNWLPLEEVPA